MITTGDIVGTNVDEKVLDKDAAIFSLERQMGEARIILHTKLMPDAWEGIVLQGISRLEFVQMFGDCR